ncbi:hypothetical protein I3842_01G124400 [Carya illinoinensis]|uniref:Uncharacterized protein n=1 Tax=Carya illinoinensis TaxID=32201 RepID=A0A922FY68_CARIL|nr:hypothetical protein I3842_01G124400 [Carya illinoinensis]
MDGDALSAHIDEKLDGLTLINAEEHCIFKVHEQLLTNPVLLAIGPYNDHDKVGQGLMEEHKLQYLKQMRERRNDCSVKEYIKVLRVLEGRARKCYAECISQNKDEFVEMMLLDGCFIIELVRKWDELSLRDDHDPIFQLDWMLPKIARDLLLFENQLPFLSSQTPHPNQPKHLGEHPIKIEQNNEITCFESSTSIDQSVQIRRFGDLALRFFYGSLPFQWNVNGSASYSIKDTKNQAITPPLAKIIWEHLQIEDKFKNANFKHLLDLIHTIELKKAKKFTDTKNMMKSIHNATKLKEGGVKFQKAKQHTTFSINFSNGVLEISPLTIEDETETFLRNLNAYEQYSPDIDTDYHYVTHYACFMDDLINSPKDVELLRQNEIIKNLLGDDGVASSMFNKLCRHVTDLDYPHSTLYAQNGIDMNKHCAEDWNEWKATLRHNYFNSPWA